MRNKFLHHTTLTTGHTRRSYRDEVADEVVEMLKPLLDRALSGEHVPVPGVDGFTMTGGVLGRCCMVTVWGAQTSKGRIPICSIGIAKHSLCGAKLWRKLHSGYVRAPGARELATDATTCPPEPWVGARLEVGTALYPEAMKWLGDFERCLGWAWIEYRQEQQS